MDRAIKGLQCAMGLSCGCGLIMGFFTFFHGDILAGLFTSSPSVMAAAADYLKAYAFDAFLTSFLFCFIGFYNGWVSPRLSWLKGYWDPLGFAFPFPIS